MPTSSPSPRLFSVLALVGLSACNWIGGGGGDGKGEEDGGDSGSVSHEQPCPDPDRAAPPVDELCPPQRQVGHMPDLPECPVPDPGSGWVMDVLFAKGSVPATMNNYCRYVWTGAGAPTPASLPAKAQGRTGPDCRVLPQSPLADDLAVAYEQAFVDGVEPVPNVEATLGVGIPVNVAVVDTAPRVTNEGQAAHGPAIASLVAKTAGGCVPGLDKSECRREVATYLGLPQVVGSGANLQQGGYFGYQSDLAQGIVAAVNGWTNLDEKLIVTLAVGWEPSLGDLDGGGQAPTAAIEAVQDAIELATCKGALVVSASGNQPAGSCVDQPTAPGSWERQAGADQASCQALGLALNEIALGQAGSLPAYHPLTYAATPVGWAQDNLADFRPGSDAPVAALGFAGFTTLAGRSHGPLTGSSVSTAVVSGIAALVWSYFPGLSADEVMEVVYQGGSARQVGGQTVMASHFLGQSAPEQHVVTACGAIVQACTRHVPSQRSSLSAAQCQAVTSSCAGLAAGPSAGAWWQSFSQAVTGLSPSEQVRATPPTLASQDCTRCGGNVSTLLPTATALPAASMPDPWVLPQPEQPPCPICELDDDDIYLSLDSEYAGYSLRNVSVVLYDAGGAEEDLHYGPLPLTATSVYVLQDANLQLVDRSQQRPTSAWVSMVFVDPTGATITAGNQIPVQ